MLLFDLGLIKIGNKTVACEEITISTSQENNYRYVSDQVYGTDLEPTKKKIDFTLKKPKLIENDILLYLMTNYLPFSFELYRILDKDDGAQLVGSAAADTITSGVFTYLSSFLNPIAGIISATSTLNKYSGITQMSNGNYLQKYMTLHNCLLSQVSFGPFSGEKVVTEDVQGSALYYSFDSSVSAYYDSILTNRENDFEV
jgi:hypothetical protein